MRATPFEPIAKSWVLVCSLMLFLAWSDAMAGGYYLPDRGVRAFSRGGAFTAGCDDLSALWYNPATLAGQHGTIVHLDSALINMNLDFQRYPVPEVGQDYEAVQNQADPLPDPSLSLSSDFGLEDWVFALGAYGPYAYLSNYPEDGSQRYALVRSDNFGYDLEGAIAYQPLDGLRLGAGLALVSLSINNTMAAASYPGLFGGPEERDQDGYVQFVAGDSFRPSVVIGMWLRPGRWFGSDFGLELGFSVMSGVSFNAKGDLYGRLPDHYYWDGVTLDPEVPKVQTQFSFPWLVRAGLRYLDEHLGLDGEVDFVWEGWSCFDSLQVSTIGPAYYRDVPTIGDYLVPSMTLERHFKDTWSVRAGGSWHPLDWLVVRMGGYFETGASPDEYFSVATPDGDKWALAMGAGVVLGAFELDMGYMHIFQLDKDIPVATSKIVQVNTSNPEGAVTVGGGRYSVGYDVFGLSMLVHVSDWF